MLVNLCLEGEVMSKEMGNSTYSYICRYVLQWAIISNIRRFFVYIMKRGEQWL